MTTGQCSVHDRDGYLLSTTVNHSVGKHIVRNFYSILFFHLLHGA